MRILQINTEKSWRGGERQTLLSMQAFRAAGHDVELLAREAAPLLEQARSAGFTCHGLQRSSAIGPFLARHGRRYDIIHCQTAGSLTWAVLTKWIYRRPLVFSRRTTMPVERREAMTRFKWLRADAIATVSGSAALEPRRLGASPVVIHSAVVPPPAENAAVADRLARFRADYATPGRRLIGTAASLTWEKDPETLVRALAALKKKRQDFLFLHMGTGGPLAAATHELVISLGLGDHYRHIGFLENVEDIYPALDLFVLTSVQEGLSTAVLDAFLRHVPVVSTDAGGQAEGLADGRGMLCPARDPQALADAMDFVLDHPAERAEMCRRAYAYVTTEHSVETMAQNYLDLYQSLLDRHS
ncbi:glycosyltransferase family 4 protein [Kerstersia gyiorum]|uniref:glycosyltransferase family 4 protein n=1 Tax=Kerstersia gyiorum TaxID=206506 RepID=UPI003B4374E2